MPVSVWLRQYTVKVTKLSAFHPRMTNMSSDVKKERKKSFSYICVCVPGFRVFIRPGFRISIKSECIQSAVH